MQRLWDDLEALEAVKDALIVNPPLGDMGEQAFNSVCEQITRKQNELDNLCEDIYEICD